MDRGEEKHSHISNLPHPSFHVQLIHGDVESIPRNPRDIIYPVSPGSTWNTFRRCQGDLRQSDVEEQRLCNESLSNVPHPVCEETHFTAAVWISSGLRSSNPQLPNQLVIHWISFESFLKTANGRSETQTGSVPKQHQIHFSPKQTGCENKSKPSPVIYIGFSIAASLRGLSVQRDHGLRENSKIRS